MPEENKTVVDIKKNPKTISLTKKKLIIISGLILLILIGLLLLAYFLGKGLNNEPIKTEKKATQSAETDIKKVDLGEEVTVKSGLTLTLEKATIDATYERQKEEQRKFLEKYASKSPELEDSEFLKTSKVNLKLAIRNKTSKTLSYDLAKFRLKDSGNNVYNPNILEFTAKALLAGELVRENVSFIVPSDEESFKLIYENAIIEFEI